MELLSELFPFASRLSRSTYVPRVLVGLVVAVLALVLRSPPQGASSDAAAFVNLFLIIFWAAFLLAAVSGRLRDIDASPWIALLLFVPIVGAVMALVLMFVPGHVSVALPAAPMEAQAGEGSRRRHMAQGGNSPPPPTPHTASTASNRFAWQATPVILGFALVAAAIVGAMLAFSNAQNYVPRAGLVWNMQHAELFSTFNSTGLDTYAMSLGTALALCATTGLLGVGLAIFGRRRPA